MRLTANKIAGLLRQHGYKLTPQRHAVLKVIARSYDHLTPAAIYERVRQENPGIGRVTIYRTLDLLTRLRLICKLHGEDNRQSYLMRRPAGHHHHLICSYCGFAIDFTDCNLSELEERLSRKAEFEIESHRLEFHGRCHNCQQKAPA